MTSGVFVISLDFELHWGVSDHRTVENYYENLKNTPEVVRGLLKIFQQRKIHATWATVGMLICRTKKELSQWVKTENQPGYNNPSLSNYNIISGVGENETTDPFHFGGSLVKEIIKTPFQELGTHTFSHYYCLEPGQTTEQFNYDLQAAREINKREGVQFTSIVFPRNQYNDKYLNECKRNGLKCYRGNYPSWIYSAQAKSNENIWKRAARLFDTYLALTGRRLVRPEMSNGLLNIPASCFLRPYNKRLNFFETFKIQRIKNEMKSAAKRNTVYHLWWHPHNFGKNMDKNFENLNLILDNFDKLAAKYGMVSMNMKEIYDHYCKT